MTSWTPAGDLAYLVLAVIVITVAGRVAVERWRLRTGRWPR